MKSGALPYERLDRNRRVRLVSQRTGSRCDVANAGIQLPALRGPAALASLKSPRAHRERRPMQSMTPQAFVEKWQRANLSERSAYQQHFLDICDLLGEPKPADADPEGAEYTFERGVTKTTGGKGWADVWKRGHFGWGRKARDLLELHGSMFGVKVSKRSKAVTAADGV
jgi:hypothetical protein